MKRILGFVGWIGVLLVLAALVVRFRFAQYQAWSQGLALAGLVATALYALSQWRDIARSFQGKNVKYGSIAAASVALVLAILVGVNWVSSRENKRWDLTGAGQFTLSDQSRKLVSGLTKPVTIRVFYVSRPNAPSIQDYKDQLAEYTYLSKQVKTDFVDADRNPTEAHAAGVTTVPTFVLEYDGRTEKANAPDEQTLTNALKRVIEGKVKKVYFLQGHGERDPTGSDGNGYSGIVDQLKNDNFEVAKLDLAMQPKVPDDATVIVIAGPTRDLLPAEATAMADYLRKGGKLMIQLDPPDKATTPDPSTIVALAHDWGVTIGRDVVVDASSIGQQLGPTRPLAKPSEPAHPITSDMNMFNAYESFPLARSVVPIEGGINGHTAQKLVETGPGSWAITDLNRVLSGSGQIELSAAKGDKKGPFSIAVAVSAPAADAPASADASAPKPESRLVVVGDSDFAANSAVAFSANGDFFLNSVNWLAQQEDLIAIRPKSPQDRPITMTSDQGRLVLIFTLLVIPLLLFATGVRVWWKRR